jgi:tripartite-type tricarboxylate transporter receptor subunit TctC
MPFSHRLLLASSLSACCTVVVCADVAHGQTYPSRPIRLIVPFPPGGGNDILARTVGQRLTEVIGQQIVVDNRAGAGGVIGATTAAQALPDGYTLFLGSVGNLAHNPALKENLPYNPVRDFAAVSLLATSSFILLVNPSVPAKSVQDLIALAKASPGKLDYASSGSGSSLHMAMELFRAATGIDMLHVPYKGANAMMVDLVSGRVHVVFTTMPPALPHVKSGKLRALGVSTAKRAAATPDVPTIAESGVTGFDVSNWQGITAPLKTPQPIVLKLNRDLNATLKLAGMSDALAAQGLEAAGGTPEEFGKLIKSEIAKYTRVVKAAGIKAD